MAIRSLDASMGGKAMKCGVSSPNRGLTPAPAGARNWLNLLLVAWVAPWVQSSA
jgi:hypothetical protein